MSWKKVDEDRYMDMLGVLPPAAMTGLGFLVGEAYDHNAQGLPRFAAFVKINDNYFEAVKPMTVTDFSRLSARDVHP